MGVFSSKQTLRHQNHALREEIRLLKLQLAEAHRQAQVAATSGPSHLAEGRPSRTSQVAEGRPSRAEVIKERRKSLGELPFLGRAEKVVEGVLPLAAAFDRFDGDQSGSIDLKELRSALDFLGVPVSSTQASTILQQYDAYPDNAIDVKEFATIVRDIKLLLEFDENKDGVLDSRELLAALESLGLRIDAEQVDRILSRFDIDKSGCINLAELSNLVRTVQAFQRYDTDASGAIDLEELRSALRKLGLRAGSLEATNIFRRYDADDSGTIELHEFAVLVRDLQLYASFDTNCDGLIDVAELQQVLERVGLRLNLEEAANLIMVWDPEGDGNLDLSSFSQLAQAARIFKDHDEDADRRLDAAQLRAALRALGLDVSGASLLLPGRDATDGASGCSLEQYVSTIRELSGHTKLNAFDDDQTFTSLHALPTSFTKRAKLTGSIPDTSTRTVLAQPPATEQVDVKLLYYA